MKLVTRKSPLSRKAAWLKLAREAKYNAAQMAKLCQITTRQLERQAQLTLGCTPQQWLDEQRMVHAQALLREIDTIKNVAFQVGFKQPSHFCRQFKQHCGMTPTEFIISCERHNRPRVANG
jgi:AraC family transcriptional regulator